MKKLIIIQTSTPDYRKDIFCYLKEELKNDFKLFSGKAYFEKSVITDENIEFITPVSNYFFLKRKFLIQFGMWEDVIQNNTTVLEMNPRILSNWAILIVRKFLNRKTVLWGHAWPRGGSTSKSDIIRHLMRKLGNEIIVYTQTQANELKLKMPSKKIHAAPNSLYFTKDMSVSTDSEKINHIIFVGRLSKSKKALFMVKAFHKVLNQIPRAVQLIIVGEGEEKKTIEKYILDNRITKRVLMKGHISDIEKLKTLYSESLVSVSPGYVGLSIIQSFSFGVPMIISENEKHSPEIEASKDKINSLFFTTDNEESLGHKFIDIYNKKDNWVAKRKQIYLFCKSTYSTEAMGQTFLNVLNR